MGVIGKWRDIEYESQEEYKFLVWLFELIDHFAEDEKKIKIRRDKSYNLSEKRKVEKTNIREHSYTPEFIVFVSPESVLHEIFEGNFSTKSPCVYRFEIKPEFDQNNMTRLFKINQKWMLEKHGIFVNLVVPSKLFEKTFTPYEFMFNKKGGPRKLKYQPITLSDYVSTI